jgi:methylmalonyl-CoA/ethylmalonyl-CoA epimerase
MFKKVEHIGVAIKNLDEAESLFERLFGKSAYKREAVESEKVSTSFFNLGETKIELLESENESSAISKFIDKKGEGIHHMAFEVDDIEAELSRLKKEGFQLINQSPFKGADNKLVAFIHPKSCHGILVELCQEIK